MAEKELVNPDGSKIARVVTYKKREFPWRIVDQSMILKAEPRMAVMASLVQIGDQNNVAWLGMLTLAKDIYSRQSEGSHEFLDFMSELGMVIMDRERKTIDVYEELLKVFKKA